MINIPAMIDYLKEKGIKVIFFAEGQSVKQNYEEAMYAIKNGMTVGNRSVSHPVQCYLKRIIGTLS